MVAIAITLLVLPLVEDASREDVSSFDDLVDTSGHQFLLFALSFVVILRFWIVHHDLFRVVRAFDQRVFWLNAVWLLSIVALPYATEVLGNAEDVGAVTTGVYVGTMFVTSCAGLGLRWAVETTPDLRRSPAGEPVSLRPGVVFVAVMGLILVIAVAVPDVGPWALLLLVLTGPITRRVTRRLAT